MIVEKYIHIVRPDNKEEKSKLILSFIMKNRDKIHLIFTMGGNKNIKLGVKDADINFINDESKLAEEIMTTECKVIVW